MIIYTGGTFDLFHYGHILFLKKCKELAGNDGKLVVSLNSDEFVLSYKKKLPILSYEERKKTLLTLPFVDKVILNYGNEDSKKAINKIKPNMIAIGSDWATRDYYHQMKFTQKWLDKKGIIMCYIPYTPLISSTEIKKRFQ